MWLKAEILFHEEVMDKCCLVEVPGYDVSHDEPSDNECSTDPSNLDQEVREGVDRRLVAVSRVLHQHTDLKWAVTHEVFRCLRVIDLVLDVIDEEGGLDLLLGQLGPARVVEVVVEQRFLKLDIRSHHLALAVRIDNGFVVDLLREDVFFIVQVKSVLSKRKAKGASLQVVVAVLSTEYSLANFKRDGQRVGFIREFGATDLVAGVVIQAVETLVVVELSEQFSRFAL